MSIGTAIDRALLPVFPGWARRRMMARAHAGFLQRALKTRGIEGGPVNRTSGRARHPKDGPKTKTLRDLEATRAQARDLYRYNPYARGVVNTIVSNLISCGIKPQARVVLPKKQEPDERFNDAAEEVWKTWADGCDPSGKEHYYEQQSMLERELFVAGEALLVFSDPKDDRKYPLATEVIPSERLCLKDQWDRKGPAQGGKIVQGVQFTADGRIEGYWVYPNHPWDSIYGVNKETLIPADRVIHFYDPLEPGAVRGLTRFLCVAGAFEGFMQWLDWLLTKERVSSAFALAIIENAGMGLQSPIKTGEEEDLTDDNLNEIDYLEGGIVAHLKAGEDIKGVQSGVQASAVDLLSQVFLRVIARGLDVSYEVVARDLSKVTYLSARQGENQDRRHWEPQQERLNRSVNKRVWDQVLGMGYVQGALPVRGPFLPRHKEVEFVRPGWDWIDPSKDIEGDISAINAGLRSPLETIVKRGGDPYRVLRDCAQFQAWVKELGLELTLFQPPKAAAPEPAEKPEAEKPEVENGEDETESPNGESADAA